MSADLDLAQGALTGNIEALRAFDALVASLPVSDDARQAVRHKALVDGRLKEFDGRGALRSWLKTVALRLEVDLQRASKEDAVEDRVLDALLPASEHLEAQLVTNEARRLLREAVRHALEGLAPREKLWVQHHHLDGMTLTAIGVLYSVAPSTVMRALDRSLEQLRSLVREHLVETHQLGLASLNSLVRAGVA
ncbi:MAG: sigma-70 family RNA polymerase sigma factor [Myxococcales bacterium]|nr:sigma-70 family RNA polymerase sigma factor [Myxococcales bacterium]